MPVKLDDGFVKADSTNLPKVTCFMVWEHIVCNEHYTAPEVKGVKATLSSRENYGDAAVGYVCVKRTGNLCTVKASVCPEHRVKNKDYTVIMTINEKQEIIRDLACKSEQCKASEGGCKHTIAFLMWMNRRFEQPSPTDVECYWKKSRLSSIGTEIKFIKLSEMKVRTDNCDEVFGDNSTFLSRIQSKAEELQLDSQLSRYLFDSIERRVNCLSMHQLVYEFYETTNAVDFFEFAVKQMAQDLCQKIEVRTRNQSNEILWHEMRFGRVTASIVYEVAHCNTSGGSLVYKIVGASKVYDNFFMRRGRNLEKDVIKKAALDLSIGVHECGLILIPEHPFLGASPDGVGDDFIVEVKCPGSKKTVSKYIKNGVIGEKFKAQMNLQMFAAKKSRGLFIVADPDFEKNQKYQHLWINFDENYAKALIKRSEKFWKDEIYPILIKPFSV